MMLGPAIIARLEADAAIVAAVGDKIHWLIRPQGVANDLPAIVVQVVSEERTQHLKGFEDMAVARVQASCMAEKYSASRKLAEEVIRVLVPIYEAQDAESQIVFWRGSVDGPRDMGNQEETRFVHRAVVDLTIRYGTVALTKEHANG
jgi:hypothetical protein